ncbi:hypothetical protein BJ508DRAFT_413281 [Ascobolus immersus RN42]|uniref:GRF-type domain-containing protein n=1 Tax=Ascobolus immersus RN42 TaxID=1160509 RepID=A0A3N4IFZ7_ASCIM|nr:hypothetical protein BJ508DRAFT_413281 [Ascobolus immersus RN42]
MAAVGPSAPSSSHYPASTIPQTQPTQQNNNNNTGIRGIFQDGYWLCDCKPRQIALKHQTKKQTVNFGRWFYGCPKYREARHCNFFLWEDTDALAREAEYWEQHPELDKHAALNANPVPTPTISRIGLPPTPDTQRRVTDYYNTPNHAAPVAPSVVTPPESPSNRLGKKRARPEASKIRLDGDKTKGRRNGRIASRATTYDSGNESNSDEREADYQRYSIQTSRKKRRVNGRESVRDKSPRYTVTKKKEKEVIPLDEDSETSYGSEGDDEALQLVASVNRQLFPTHAPSASSSTTSISSNPKPFQASSPRRQPQASSRPVPSRSKDDDSVFLTPALPAPKPSSPAPIHVYCTTPQTHRTQMAPPSSAPAVLPSPSQACNSQPTSTPLPPPGLHEQTILKLLEKHKVRATPALREDLLKELRRHERVLRGHITGKNFVRGMLKEKEKEVTDLKVKVEVAGVTGSFENTFLASEEDQYESDNDGSSTIAGTLTRESTVATTTIGDDDDGDDDAWSSYGGYGRRARLI